MDLVLIIALFGLVLANLWIMFDVVRQKRRNERKLQERIEEFNQATDMHIAELQGARHRVEEAISNSAVIKKQYDSLLKEHEALYKEYEALKSSTSHCGGDPHAEHQGPVDNGGVSVVGTTAGEAHKPTKNYKRKAK